MNSEKYFAYISSSEQIIEYVGITLPDADSPAAESPFLMIEISKSVYDDYLRQPPLYVYREGQVVKLSDAEYADYKNTEIKRRRAERYAAEVDPLTAEYNRKQITGCFDKGEAEKLKAVIDAATQKIKNDLPYTEAAE